MLMGVFSLFSSEVSLMLVPTIQYSFFFSFRAEQLLHIQLASKSYGIVENVIKIGSHSDRPLIEYFFP